MSALEAALAETVAPVVERAVESAMVKYLASRPETYSPREVSKIAGCSVETIYQAIDDGTLWILDLPTSHVRIPRQAVDELLARPDRPRPRPQSVRKVA